MKHLTILAAALVCLLGFSPVIAAAPQASVALSAFEALDVDDDRHLTEAELRRNPELFEVWQRHQHAWGQGMDMSEFAEFQMIQRGRRVMRSLR